MSQRDATPAGAVDQDPRLCCRPLVFAIPLAPTTDQPLCGLDGSEKTRRIEVSDLLCRQSANLSAMTVNAIPAQTTEYQNAANAAALDWCDQQGGQSYAHQGDQPGRPIRMPSMVVARAISAALAKSCCFSRLTASVSRLAISASIPARRSATRIRFMKGTSQPSIFL